MGWRREIAGAMWREPEVIRSREMVGDRKVRAMERTGPIRLEARGVKETVGWLSPAGGAFL
jgi:hypothetical protein